MTLRLLVVCTANVCRSPVAERLLARHLADRGVDAEVRSAGVDGGRLAVHEDTVVAAQTLDLDLSDHESRLLLPDMIATEGADLVIAMTREHLREVVAMEPGAWPRAFTLKELARQAPTLPLDEPVEERIAPAAKDRAATELMSPSPDDDLADPYGGPARAHLEMVREVDALTARIAGALA